MIFIFINFSFFFFISETQQEEVNEIFFKKEQK